MRVILAAAVLVVTAARARACPPAAACAVIARGAGVAEPGAPGRAARPVPRVDLRSPLRLRFDADHDAPLARSLRSFVPARRRAGDDPAMPWLWQVLRHRVYRRLPHYTRRRVDITVSPLAITGTFDTVPGVGAGGAF